MGIAYRKFSKINGTPNYPKIERFCLATQYVVKIDADIMTFLLSSPEIFRSGELIIIVKILCLFALLYPNYH